MEQAHTILDLAKKFQPHMATREIWGQRVFNEIRSLLELNYKVEISFKGMVSASPSFLDESFGKLVEEFDLDYLKTNIKFTNISDYYRVKVNKAIIRRNKLKIS